eukprot:m.857126 g.857126  ORF g.857126 m.857126 type:complete len:52 (-) comp59642_c0_seq4:473-628(-)
MAQSPSAATSLSETDTPQTAHNGGKLRSELPSAPSPCKRVLFITELMDLCL